MKPASRARRHSGPLKRGFNRNMAFIEDNTTIYPVSYTLTYRLKEHTTPQ